MKKTKKLAVLVAVALVLLAAASMYLLVKPINSSKISPMRNDAVYRNGLYIITLEVENGEATAAFQNDFMYYDGRVTGDIQITENRDYSYAEISEQEPETFTNAIRNKYVFTWASETDEYQMQSTQRSSISYRHSSSSDIVNPVEFSIYADKAVQAGEEDILISIYITGFDQPLQFIIPAEGTAPEHGILYGKFSPSDVIYLSSNVSDDSESFLIASENVVFNVYDNVLAIYNPDDVDMIQKATYRLLSNGYALDDTIKYFGLKAVPEVDISGFTSKIMFTADGIGENRGECAVMLMDDETWIGHWSRVEDETYGYINVCDYIFKVKNANE